MKNTKRVLAIIGVVVLLVIFCLPMLFAFGNGENSQLMFKVSIGLVITVPVLAYICLMAVKVLGRKAQPADGEIKNVVFDVGMVLVDFQWREYLAKFGYPEETAAKVAKATFQSDVWNERDRGALSEEEYVQQMVQLAPECEKEIREVMADVDKTIVPFDYSETWVRYLQKQGYHTYVLSNLSHFMLDRSRNRLAFLRYMDGTVFSCDELLIKPEADLYRLLLNRFGLKPQETVFLDDREENCEAARREGIHAICFRDFKQAAEELKKLGVGVDA